ncbi:MAG: single-stranded DNA-binding protein [Leptolyngbyaceae cyanobacterium]
MNNVNLLGRFGKDPELRFFEGSGGQNAVAKFSLAVDERVKRDGQWVKQPVWVNCEAWGKLASDVIGKYCQKGTQVAITGKLKVEKWQDRNTGDNRQKMIVNVQGLDLVGSKDNQGQSRPPASQAQSASYDDGPPIDSYQDPQNKPGGVPDYDSIPFSRFGDELIYGA